MKSTDEDERDEAAIVSEWCERKDRWPYGVPDLR